MNDSHSIKVEMLIPDTIMICGRCGYEAWRKNYPCNRCGWLQERLYVPLDEIVRVLTDRDDDGSIVGGWSAAQFLLTKFGKGLKEE